MVLVPQQPFSSYDTPVHRTAMQAHQIGMSALPIRADGTKRPALCAWKTYSTRLPTKQELLRWFEEPCLGIGLVTGAISGHLEALDFDHADVFNQWLAHVRSDQDLSNLYALLSWGYEEATPGGGRHLLYRCATPVGASQKLASRPVDSRWKTVIETRGEGSLVIIAPSGGGVHPSGRPYLLLSGSLASIATITQEQRERLLASASRFDDRLSVHTQHPVPSPHLSVVVEKSEGHRPGDLFNLYASWEDILPPHGWTLIRRLGEEGYWRRPGKEDPGISATTNFRGSDLLYVFSTSSAFEAGRSYTKFGAYTVLNHHGDFAAAARDLAAQRFILKARYDENS